MVYAVKVIFMIINNNNKCFLFCAIYLPKKNENIFKIEINIFVGYINRWMLRLPQHDIVLLVY